MTEAPYFKILHTPAAFWTANCNEGNIPEIVRCMGVATVTDLRKLTIYVGERFSGQYIKNFETNRNMTLAATDVPTFESYQYKGLFSHARTCTPGEEALQQQYLDQFTDVIAAYGHSKELYIKSFTSQPSFAITFEVHEIFEQTPHKSTGRQVIKFN